jgi:2-C-methyl-D-erythritol 4-phosphate cytidylyltransferase
MGESVAVIICAAGSSTRMGGVKKEYLQLTTSHLTVLGSSVLAFSAVPSVETIVIVIPENGEAAVRAALPAECLAAQKPKIMFTTGGKTRQASVFNGLSLLAATGNTPRYVLIHDGARPWVSIPLIEKTLVAAVKHGAAIPLLPLTDTPKEISSELSKKNKKPRRARSFTDYYRNYIQKFSVLFRVLRVLRGKSNFTDIPIEESGAAFISRHLKRANTGLAQTPQGFLFPEILQAHEKAALETEEFTDDAEIWGKFCGPVAVVPGEAENKKITYQGDI